MIRKATKNDLKQINILGSLYDEKFTNHYNLDFYLSNDNYIVNVEESNNKIVAFVIADKISETIEIQLIYVAKDYRQQGTGTKLINSLITNDVDNLLLEVSVDNQKALALYKKLDFIEINKRIGYYNGIDCLVMKKEIK